MIVLMGGSDLWSNGIHLNVIEVSEDPAGESWNNINAMNDLIKDIILTDTQIFIAAIQGNAGAGGVILALAADYLYARKGVVLNPHYKGMGGLYGSEYWTYLLPKRIGKALAKKITENCTSLETSKAKNIGLINDCLEEDLQTFKKEIIVCAEKFSNDSGALLELKRDSRLKDENEKPLEEYRKEELDRMWENFYSSNSLYHEARRKFVYKVCPTQSEVKINKKITPKLLNPLCINN